MVFVCNIRCCIATVKVEFKNAPLAGKLTTTHGCTECFSLASCSASMRCPLSREVPQTLLDDLINFPLPDIVTAWESPDLGPVLCASSTSEVDGDWFIWQK